VCILHLCDGLRQVARCVCILHLCDGLRQVARCVCILHLCDGLRQVVRYLSKALSSTVHYVVTAGTGVRTLENTAGGGGLVA
jgi:hypothetical protein